ncbi:hypothetical protein [Diplocloster agilis]|uniref:Uncharacterized protein n=1 Tax=Diplocloster agilis TaxID=2850323 RepID=A0A949NC64_9FIRM|nr:MULTISPECIES: hypothetical protein [Lachnospiraceae]MBU9738332.1 hypothetical protein [Diplocloster agilis]MCU6734120.1 hypothetical protein [Suonthocola fibrivorans]SCJ24526.1 Uncharacterised protein [uncultured Clostridium sp.]
MLGKLIKYDLISVSKILFPLHLALLVVTVLGRLSMALNLPQNAPLIVSLMLMLYIFGIIAIGIITLVVLVMRFYKNLFTSEGYLMHTLPVKASQHLNSKLIVAVLWSILDCVFIIFSIFILLVNQPWLNQISAANWAELKEMFSIIFLGGGNTMVSILFLCLYMLIANIYIFLSFYVSICIGQLMNKHKVLGSFLAYLVIYVISQILSVISMLFFGLSSLRGFPVQTLTFEYYRNLMTLSIVETLAFSIVFYLISNYMISKKLNLD